MANENKRRNCLAKIVLFSTILLEKENDFFRFCKPMHLLKEQ